MSKLAIEWNEKADRYLAPLQRDALEQGLSPRRLEGKVECHPDGTVWYRCAGTSGKIVGTWNAPKAEKRASDELNAPDGQPESVPAKSTKKKARKRK
jgi:hypothetical protein